MESAMEKMEAQLKRWRVRIDHLAAKTQVTGAPLGFDALMYIDELKALHAIAYSKLNELRAVEDTRRARLQVEMKTVWDDLDTAMKKRMP